MSLKNKPLALIAVIVIAAVVIAALSHFSGGLPEKAASGLMRPVEGIISKVISPVAGIFDGVSEKELEAENEKLKEQVYELTAENRTAEEYIRENERLRALLHLKEGMVNQEVTAARVTALGWDNFSQTVTINRGTADGVNLENAVVSTLGIIGRVSEVTKHSATVTTLLSPRHSLGVRVSRTADLAVCEGDAVLAKDNKLRLDYISGAAELIEGDIIETSGVGGVYPEGLMVGKISEIKKDNSGAVSYAVVEPTADFSRLYEVLVITDWTRESTSPEYIMDEPQEEVLTTEEITDSEIENAEG